MKKLRDDKVEDKFKWLVENKKDFLVCPDQDVLVACCYNKTKILPPKYNTVVCFLMCGAYSEFYGKFQNDQAFKNPTIVHFAVQEFKPWKYPNVQFAEKWWDYAIKSGFYDKLPTNLEIKKKIS